MGIDADSQLLEPGSLVVLYELDATAINGDVLLFHGYEAPATWWQGRLYNPWPIIGDGFAITGEGRQPAPTLKVGNVDGKIGALAVYLNDLVGAKLTRRRTLAKYLDGQPDANPEAKYPDDVFYVEQKTGHNKEALEFELRSALDLSTVYLPKRQIVANVCSWLTIGGYRGPNCGYTGSAGFTAEDTPTLDPALDKCGGRVRSCRARFPNQDMPFGGFPSASLQR